MNITLFVAQLNQLLQSANSAAHLEDVCDLLRVHICATVTVTNQSGQPIVELLQPKPHDGTQNQAEGMSKTMPIIAGDTTLGNISLCRIGDPFTEAESLALSVAVSICTILLRHKEAQTAASHQRSRDSVRNLINTLSFSELEAAIQIIKGLGHGKTEGLLIAGHIADRLGFTRSVVTAALKKLEGASLIETRSLGMKGTYIRIKDALLPEELGKL